MVQRLRDFFQSHMLALSGGIVSALFCAYYLEFLLGLDNGMRLFGLLALVGMGALGFLAGVLIPYQLLWWFLRAYRRRNGTAIEKGCWVRILAGPHRNKIARVYECWDSRGEVRLDLGKDLKESVKDVFITYRVTRVEPSTG